MDLQQTDEATPERRISLHYICFARTVINFLESLQQNLFRDLSICYLNIFKAPSQISPFKHFMLFVFFFLLIAHIFACCRDFVILCNLMLHTSILNIFFLFFLFFVLFF